MCISEIKPWRYRGHYPTNISNRVECGWTAVERAHGKSTTAW
jgi:hypothetical protein